MISFLTFCESLDTPFPFHWTKKLPEYWEASFTLADGTPYVCSFLDHPRGWEVTFAPHPTTRGSYYDIVGDTKQEFRIFATVVACVKQFVAQVKPSKLYFTAKEPSRVRLYRRFMSGVPAAIPGYGGSAVPNYSRGFDAEFLITKTGT